MSPGAIFPHLLNTFRHSDFTISLGSLFQCLTILFVNKFFLTSHLSLCWYRLRHLVLSLVTWEKSSTSPKPPFRQFWRVIKSPLSLFLCRLNAPQLPQIVLIRLMLHALHQLCRLCLDMLQPLNVPLVLRGPKLNIIFKVKYMLEIHGKASLM